MGAHRRGDGEGEGEEGQGGGLGGAWRGGGTAPVRELAVLSIRESLLCVR
jgi:hypothetical protein